MSRRPAPRRCPRPRRASAAVAMVIVLVVLQLALVGAIAGGGGSGGASAGGAGSMTQSRLDATRAFYAAEAGVNMSLREIMLSFDADADGAIGSISDDGDDANDPTFGAGSHVRVSRAAAGADVVLTSRSRSGNARRAVRATLQ